LFQLFDLLIQPIVGLLKTFFLWGIIGFDVIPKGYFAAQSEILFYGFFAVKGYVGAVPVA